jgi:hypothetical protein
MKLTPITMPETSWVDKAYDKTLGIEPSPDRILKLNLLDLESTPISRLYFNTVSEKLD